MTDKTKQDKSHLREVLKDLSIQNENEKKDQNWLVKAETLCEALPYMKRFAGETFVIKFGGSAICEDNIKKFAKDVVLLKQVGINPIIIHGGGPQIGEMLKRLNIQTSFIDGLRVTDAKTIEIVEMVLSGSINKNIVNEINLAGGMAIGLSGKDGNMLVARKLTKTKKDPNSNIEQIINLGFVGEPVYVNPEVLNDFEDSNIIPVIAPIAVGENGETYNINADTFAGAIAGALNAAKLIILSDVDGVLLPNGELISHLSISTARKLIADGVIKGGMIPKIETCISALESEVEYAHILNGSIEHILLMEIFTESGAGTMIFYG